MNVVILPGVTLGDHTAVAAGAVVNTSHPEGYCIVAGVPAKIVKRLDPTIVVEQRNPYEYIGYYRLGNSSKEELYKRLGVKTFLPSSKTL
jgi:serine acetyltransferase